MADVETPVAETPTAERGLDLIQKHVAATEALVAAEKATEDGEAPPEPEAAAEPGKGKQRGADGKFLKAGEKPVEELAKAEPAKKEPPAKEPAEPPAAGIAKAQRLVREGKIADALSLIGLDPEKLPGDKWAAWRHENKKAATALGEGRQAVERDRNQLMADARQLVQDFQPLIQARQAFAQEDYESAFKLAFGMELNDFQRTALQKMANPSAGKDPAVLAMREELRQMKEAQARREEQEKTQRSEADLTARRQAKWDANVSELAESGDPRFAKAAKLRPFMGEVWRVQAEHYDPQTDTTLPASEAAELVLEKDAAWAEVFGGGSPPPDAKRDRGATTHAATGPGGNQVRRSAKSTSLNQTEAAEATPAVKLKGKELLDYHVRKTEQTLRTG